MAKKVAKKVKKKVTKKKNKQLPKKDLTNVAIGVIMNSKGTYDLATLKFHPGTKQAYVEKIEKLADEHYQAVFQIKKLLAHGIIVPEKK